MTRFQQASCDRQIAVRESYTQRGLNVPPHLHAHKIAERLGVDVKEVEARMRVRGTP